MVEPFMPLLPPLAEGVGGALMPVRGRLTSGYGVRMSRRSERRRFHAGVDFEAKRGVPVRSVRGGIVEAVPRNRERGTGFGGYGNAVIVRHEDEGVWVLYAHLDSTNVRPGDEVAPGQVIGRAGRTSNRRFRSMAPHLHLEVRVATPEGASPFPGSYRRYNVDPRCWFARHGLYYGSEGEPEAHPVPLPARCRG
ncbi:MAG: M23 family metallopeptidase [Polyangiaceae bacterium]|nr:M23 family metallopeptidase [Polyangiaceae bacterium]